MNEELGKMKNYKLIGLNKNAAVVIRFSERIIQDYLVCEKKKAELPGYTEKGCTGCSLDIPGNKNGECLRTMFPEIEEELEKRKAGDQN